MPINSNPKYVTVNTPIIISTVNDPDKGNLNLIILIYYSM